MPSLTVSTQPGPSLHCQILWSLWLRWVSTPQFQILPCNWVEDVREGWVFRSHPCPLNVLGFHHSSPDVCLPWERCKEKVSVNWSKRPLNSLLGDSIGASCEGQYSGWVGVKVIFHTIIHFPFKVQLTGQWFVFLSLRFQRGHSPCLCKTVSEDGHHCS